MYVEDDSEPTETFGEPLLTARQVAGLLALSPHTVLDWFERGELPGVKLNGRAVRFVPAEVRAWVEGQR